MDEYESILKKTTALQLPKKDSQQGDSPEAWRAWATQIFPQETNRIQEIATYASQNSNSLEELITKEWNDQIKTLEKNHEALEHFK